MTEKLLTELGISAESLAGLTEEKLPELKQAVVEKVKAQLLESEDFYAGLDTSKLPKEFSKQHFDEGVKKVTALSRQAIDKHFGITEIDKKDWNPEEVRDIHKYVAKAVGIFKTRAGASDTDIAKLQDENLNLKNVLTEREDAIKTMAEKYEAQLQERLAAKEAETLAMFEATRLQGSVPVPVGLIFDKVFAGIKNKYAVVVDSGVASLRKKDNPSFRVPTADNKGYITLQDAFIDELKALGVWKEEEKKAEPVKVQIEPGKGSKIPDKIREAIERENALFS